MLKEIAQAIKKEDFNLPIYQIDLRENFGCMMFVTAGFDSKENWSHGIFENSRYLSISIYPTSFNISSDNEEYNMEIRLSYYLSKEIKEKKIKLLQCNKKNTEQIISHVIKQINKLSVIERKF